MNQNYNLKCSEGLARRHIHFAFASTKHRSKNSYYRSKNYQHEGKEGPHLASQFTRTVFVRWIRRSGSIGSVRLDCVTSLQEPSFSDRRGYMSPQLLDKGENNVILIICDKKNNAVIQMPWLHHWWKPQHKAVEEIRKIMDIITGLPADTAQRFTV